MPRFTESGVDTCICQICGREVTEATWRPDLTGKPSAGNICSDCLADMVEVPKTCHLCKQIEVLSVRRTDLMRWNNGALIQRAMPYLSESKRELLISATCEKCWDEMFA